MAACLASKEAIWLSRVIGDLQVESAQVVPTIGVDNNGAAEMARNESINDRTKHIDIQYHFVRQAVKSRKLKLVRCQVADPLTKALERVKHDLLTNAQGVGPLKF